MTSYPYASKVRPSFLVAVLVVSIVPASIVFPFAGGTFGNSAGGGNRVDQTIQAAFEISGCPFLLNTVIFTAKIRGSTVPYSIKWSSPFGIPSGGSGAGFSTVFPTGGSYPVTMTLEHAGGTVQTVTRSVAILAQPIIVCFNFTPEAPITGKTVNFAAVTGPFFASGLIYAWDFGDGSTGSESSSSHVYKVKGTYIVKLAVTDSAGVSGTWTSSLFVRAGRTSNVARSTVAFSSTEMPGVGFR